MTIVPVKRKVERSDYCRFYPVHGVVDELYFKRQFHVIRDNFPIQVFLAGDSNQQ